MAYFDDDIKSTAANMLLGIIMGYVSFLLNAPLASLLAAAAVCAGASLISKRFLRLKKEKKWWLGGAFVFALTWIISWTLLYNL